MKKRIVPSMLITFFLGLMLVAYQNFRMISPHISEDLKSEIHCKTKVDINLVEDFYKKNSFSKQKRKYYNSPKEYLKEKLKASPAYAYIKNLSDLDGFKEEETLSETKCSSNENCSAISKTEDKSEMKIRINPLKEKASLKYKYIMNTEISYEDELKIKASKAFGEKASFQLEHLPEQNRTYVQYLLQW